MKRARSAPGRLITSVTWTSPERERVARETGLLVFDTERDEILSYEVDTRCTGASEIVEMPNGAIYFATGPDEVVDTDELRGNIFPGGGEGELFFECWTRRARSGRWPTTRWVGPRRGSGGA